MQPTGARIVTGTQIHPTAYMSGGVELGKNVTIGPFVSIMGPCQIGDSVWIGAHSSLGSPPELVTELQNSAWTGDLHHAGVVINDDVVIRENVVIHQGTQRPTSIGASSWVLNHSYIAHDVEVGHSVTISAGVSIGGHCLIQHNANLGLNVSVHQRRMVGAGAMIGMGTPLTKDVPPYATVVGSPARIVGVNRVAMIKKGISPSTIDVLCTTYNQLDVVNALLANKRRLSEIDPEISNWLILEPLKPARPT